MRFPLRPKTNSNTLLIAMFCVPTVVILLVSIALIVSLLGRSAGRLDQAELAAERRTAEALMAGLDNAFGKVVVEDANWDELYDQVRGVDTLDADWAKDNLSFKTIDAYSLSEVLVVADTGLVKYSFLTGGGKDDVHDPADIAQLTDLTRKAIASWYPDQMLAMHGVIRFKGKPHLAAISPIIVNSRVRLERGEKPTNSLIFLREIDEEMLRKLGVSFDLHGLRFVPGRSGRLPLQGPAGSGAPFSLDWDDPRLGSDLFRDSLPPIVFVGAAVVLMFVALGFGWAFVVGRMRLTETRAVAAEETSRLKSEFIANMSHELRTPLNAIIGFSELIATESFGQVSVPHYKEFAADILAGGNQLLGLVDNILLLSSLEAGQYAVSLEALSLERELSEVVENLRIQAERRLIHIACSPVPATIMVRSDAEALRRILFNVIGNAIKFSHPGSTVSIEVQEETAEGRYGVRITDEGCGIPPNTLRELGQAFTLSGSSYSRRYQGAGLGLAIAFGLARRIGLTIDIASTEGVGTSVSIAIPTVPLTERPAPRLSIVAAASQPIAKAAASA